LNEAWEGEAGVLVFCSEAPSVRLLVSVLVTDSERCCSQSRDWEGRHVPSTQHPAPSTLPGIWNSLCQFVEKVRRIFQDPEDSNLARRLSPYHISAAPYENAWQTVTGLIRIQEAEEEWAEGLVCLNKLAYTKSRVSPLPPFRSPA
jgi:hypothetical protein